MKFTREIKIALVAIVGIIVLFFGLNFLKGLTVFSSTAYYMTFSNVNGVAASTPIYADGYKVGVVTGVDFDYERKGATVVKIDLDPELRVPEGSSAEISSDMLGNVQVNLLLANNPKEKMEPGDTIPGAIASGLMGKAAELVPLIEQMLPKLDSILTNVNKITGDPAITASLHNLETTTSNLTTTTRELNSLMSTLNHNVPGILRKADGVLDNTEKFTGNLAQLDVQGTLNKVNTTLDNVQTFTKKLNSNQGSLGMLMNDPSLYNNLNSTVRSADSLVNDLKNNPKRYVHFSVFGKKDKQ